MGMNGTGRALGSRESERAISTEELPLQVLMRAERDRPGPDWWGRHRWFFPFQELVFIFFFSFLFFFLACASLFACDHVDLVRNAKKLKWASICRMAIPVVSYYN